jgi:hypothetical protein
VHQVGCKISILYHDARSKILQKRIEGSSIFEAACLPPPIPAGNLPFTCPFELPLASNAQLVGQCVLFASVVVVQFEYLKCLQGGLMS